MKKSAKRFSGQMNLSLLNPPTMIIPKDKEGELMAALAELLTNAAQEDAQQESQGGRDESEAHA